MFVYIDRIVLLFGAWDDRNMLLLEFLFGKRSGSIALNFRKQFLSEWCYRTAPCLVLVRKTQRFDNTKYSEAVPFQFPPQYLLSYSYSSPLMSTSTLPVLVVYSYSQSLFPTRSPPPPPHPLHLDRFYRFSCSYLAPTRMVFLVLSPSLPLLLFLLPYLDAHSLKERKRRVGVRE